MVRALDSCGSLAGAARLLDLTPPALTVRLRRLEVLLGVHLAVRGARGITFTDEGRRLLDKAVDVLERIEAIPEHVGGEASAMTGRLRVAAPLGFGRTHMAPIVRDLHLAHPSLTIALHLADHPLREAADHDVVIHIGAMKDSSWVAHHLAANERMLCASPDLAQRLADKFNHPSQLQEVVCLCLKENDEDVTRWRFTQARAGSAKPREVVNIRVAGPLTSNDGAVVTQWAVDGMGVLVRSEWEAAPLVAQGKLVRLLPDWRLDDAPVLALTPTRTGASARLRTFIEACKTALQPLPWRPRVPPN